MWDFNTLAIHGYGNWEKVNGRDCAYVEIASRSGSVDSRKIAIEFDDIAAGKCYYRDWTSDGMPFVNDGEEYASGFWFEKLSDAKKFYEKYGGTKNW